MEERIIPVNTEKKWAKLSPDAIRDRDHVAVNLVLSGTLKDFVAEQMESNPFVNSIGGFVIGLIKQAKKDAEAGTLKLP